MAFVQGFEGQGKRMTTSIPSALNSPLYRRDAFITGHPGRPPGSRHRAVSGPELTPVPSHPHLGFWDGVRSQWVKWGPREKQHRETII